ncbi:nuclear transport factor 2 family protein [Ruegeria denitrificans]|nr:nuclear transport factor 2 family protein [Ruegeria denitrificans]
MADDGAGNWAVLCHCTSCPLVPELDSSPTSKFIDPRQDWKRQDVIQLMPKMRAIMEELVEIGRTFVQAMRDRRGLANVDEMYAENAQSIEAVVPPVRQFRITKGSDAIKGKREDWLAAHEIIEFDVDGPYVHPPNRFSVRYKADVKQKETGQRITLSEIAVYSVADGKIVLEEFFMLPK